MLLGFFDTWFLGKRTSPEHVANSHPLSFITHKTGKADDAKRLHTVKGWCDISGYFPDEKTPEGHPKYGLLHKGSITEFANVPTRGFCIERPVSRYSTDNKWFTILDPRGFAVQITTGNLYDVIATDTVVNGVLQGEYVWARYNSNIYLVNVTDKEYVEYLKRLEVPDVLEFGDVFDTTGLGDNVQYVRDGWLLKITSHTEWLVGNAWQKVRPPHYSYGFKRVEYETREVTTATKSGLSKVFAYEPGLMSYYASDAYATLKQNPATFVIRKKKQPIRGTPENNKPFILTSGAQYGIVFASREELNAAAKLQYNFEELKKEYPFYK